MRSTTARSSSGLNGLRKNASAPASRAASAVPPSEPLRTTTGIAFVAGTEIYYLAGNSNFLGKNDPIGKEASFADVVAAANAARKEIGAKWFVTTDYRMWSMLRWHLRDRVPVVQLNERARYVGFRAPLLEGDVALYVAPEGNRNLALWDRTSAIRQTVGKVDLAWRGAVYDVYTLQKVTGFRPVLSPPPGDPLYVAAPN